MTVTPTAHLAPVQLALPGVDATATGLAGLENVDADTAATLVAHLDRASAAVNWWLGDLAVEQLIRSRSGDHSWDAVKVPDDQQHVARCVRVAVEYEPERRRPGLSWSHHQVLAHLPVRHQDRLLDVAETEGLSVAALVAVVRQERQDLEPELTDELPTRPPTVPRRLVARAYAADPHGGFIAAFDDPANVVPLTADQVARIRAVIAGSESP